ncbi:major facilitator superfamily multidrug resistance transporter HlyD/EmrA/FusE [Acetobacter estunensis NRIC 0472]|uniref:Biotin/lipoyl-binding protein n=1 Tax=Acetobacter estunensis TaxID=104097 RepID=A0A967BAK1_9PROT|nr:HlyD family secretion protein [Acetobacter estunensis]MBV1837431.1 HlyD family secretion protein [Acetobacter estunensis]NHO52787.1 biotin/lipoyl-binding protein [Acetobacter estunensis]GBQ28240.1 major facilitator superfamily multidrug resistance transporter HlyD/EmrA/FusE [Acetobacter estunensis NRIC 0472]
MPLLRTLIRVILTLAVVSLAIVLGVTLWNTYMIAPWTRDGRVRVYVVDVAPEVSGTVVQVPVVDNQFVHKGDPLYVLDPVRFRLAIREAQARLDGALEDLKLKQNDARRRMGLSGIVSAEEQEVFNSNVATQVAAVDAARAALDVAKLNLQRSVLYSPVNGYITNLNLRVGDYATAGQARLAVIDSDSYWVYGYFEETKMWGVHVGDEARVKLMGYKQIIPGHVISIARGINDTNGNPDKLGLQDVNPIFTWVRLAQRIPVRIHLDQVPEGVTLAAGMTATISVGPESLSRRGKLTSWLQDHL